jgi:DNA polymerase-3 subunit epsilon
MVIVRAIDHTGIALEDWLMPVNPRGGKSPKAAAEGPLKGQKVAILGAARDSALGHWLAAAGARVVASVGTTSTMLVISADQPFGRFYHASPGHKRATELQQAGYTIQIVTESELKAQVGRILA